LKRSERACTYAYVSEVGWARVESGSSKNSLNKPLTKKPHKQNKENNTYHLNPEISKRNPIIRYTRRYELPDLL
jgi:hypothetical protein